MREFIAEAEETLDRMLVDLSLLAEHESVGDEADPDLVNRIFRSAHSLKGMAGMFGAEAIGRVAHHLEDILGAMRLGRIALDSNAAVLLDDGVAVLAELIGQVEDADPADGDREDLRMADAFVAQIEAALNEGGEPEDADPLATLALPDEVLRALTEYEEHRLREGVRRGREISLVDSSFDIMSFEEGLAGLNEAVRALGELISTLPSPGDSPENGICFSLLIATELGGDALQSALSGHDARIRCVRPATGESGNGAGVPAVAIAVEPAPATTPADSTSETSGVEEPTAAAQDAKPVSPEESAAAPVVGSTGKDRSGSETLRSVSQTVRVDIRKLDELMNLVGELGIQRNALGDVVTRLMSEPETARLGVELGKTHRVLDRKLRELQTGVLDVRMIPLRQMFDKLERVARGLRRDLGKEVELEFVGSETELDKLIVERLVDPLVHLLRNAFDHAIEPKEERLAQGKSAAGRVRVRAVQRGNRVVVEVEDDGRGMSVDRILEKAIRQGRVLSSDALTRREILNLVFEPGFSTSEAVSETSGRGVGMDVVRSNLGEMGGSVEIATTEGQGSTVMIDLPITLAIMQALLVDVGGQRFAIPLGAVQETMAIEMAEIGHSEGREILNLRGEPLLLRRLSDEFDLPDLGRVDRRFVVVVGLGDQRLGMVVDGLAGQRDAMIKPIKGPLRQIRGIAGATELGDQDAILVIDVSAIVADSGRKREAA